MCGISGILTFDGTKVRRETITAMTDVIAYRGPNGSGAWIAPDGHLGLGHRRLSILDTSSAGAQPMHYADGRYTITFNGEIYNYIELRDWLAARGHVFKNQTDTEVLLALYAEKGESCLADLDGMFAFAIWDEREKTLFCARDRFGEKPFFYRHDTGKSFVFGSEMKCLFSQGVERRLSEARLFDYLAYNVIEDRNDIASTFFTGVQRLEPAHSLKIARDGRITKNRYWKIDPDKKTDVPFAAACTKFFELFQTSVRRRLRSDVPVGSCLSGGLDSSSIVALLNDLKQGGSFTQKTFSIRMPDPRIDEGKHMQAVIDKVHSQANAHFTWMNPEETEGLIDRVFYHNEEPLNSASVVAHWLVMKLARENGVTVLIDGQGSDEFLAGYHDYFPVYFRELYLTDRKRLAAEVAAYNKLHGRSFKTGVGFKLESLYPSLVDRFSPRRHALFQRSFCKDLSSDWATAFGHANPPWPRHTRLNDSLLDSTCSVGLPFLLRMVDRDSMAFSLEVRLPFLFHELVEFMFSMPSEYKIHEGWTKYILRKSLSPLLPESIAWRSDKVGFSTPADEWLKQGRFKERVADAIATLKQRGYLKEPLARKSWQYLMAAKLLEPSS